MTVTVRNIMSGSVNVEDFVQDQEPAEAAPVRSLRELIDRVAVRGAHITGLEVESGLAENPSFPFLAIVGQSEMKLALLLSLVNPMTGGVLLIGSRGTGKTTAVRSLVDLLPKTARSLCYYGCMPEDVEAGGIDAICPECATKYGRGEPFSALDSVRLVELPLNARVEDVVGWFDERAALHEKARLRKGILAQADRNLLYIDEVNLLADQVVDVVLDAAALGSYTVRRGPVVATYNSRFVLIGSMNPEEGILRPQLMDRFGLRVLVRGWNAVDNHKEILEAYRRVQAFRENPHRMAAAYAADTALAREEVQSARNRLPKVCLTDEVAQKGLSLIAELKIDSLRASITLFEAARAYAALDGREKVDYEDLAAVAPMALRLRRSSFITEFFKEQSREERELEAVIEQTLPGKEESI